MCREGFSRKYFAGELFIGPGCFVGRVRPHDPLRFVADLRE